MLIMNNMSLFQFVEFLKKKNCGSNTKYIKEVYGGDRAVD